jgi:hypothetical protein
MILMHAKEVIRQRSAFLLYMIVLEMTPLKTFVSGAADRQNGTTLFAKSNGNLFSKASANPFLPTATKLPFQLG